MVKAAKTGPSAKQRLARNLHYILLLSLALFLLAALVLGELFNAYESIWWWDDMLHGMSGIIIGLVGLLAIYFFNAKHTMAISPAFVAAFVFCFALAVGALWEIFEFSMDFAFHTPMQRWNMSADTTLIGHDYQGVGLRDSMSDLIDATLGAVVASVISYVAYKRKKPIVLGVMRRTFPWVRRTKTTK